ncbi:MAG: tetratricopeptide repeat protein [Hyphomonadaceae bacterium]
MMVKSPFAALAALTALAGCATMGQAGAGPASAQADAARQDGRADPAGARTNERQARTQESSQGREAQRLSAREEHAARERIGREDILTQMTFWAQRYSNTPDDRDVAEHFAEALRLGGRNDRAAQVAQEALARFPDNAALLQTLGSALIAAGNPNDALRPLALVAHADARDWKSRVTLGVALDQLGRTAEARRAYQEALAIAPDNPIILTNLGVSHLLAAEPADAETVLRQAAALPNAPMEARQNLALAVGLQGRFDEAEQLERIDLPPAIVAQNMDFIRGLISDPRSWRDMRRQ